MKKIGLIVILLMSLVLTSCSEQTLAVFADMEDLASTIYARAGLEKSGVYTEELDDDIAFAFGMGREEFDDYVEKAICYRQAVDTKGQTLYVFETEADKNSVTLAGKLYDGYEFAPCDPAEKMTVACSGKYVILFKSTAAEVDAAVESFRALSGGALRFRKDMEHHG
ncbi:MAG: hypothetical protein IJ489_01715 [Clostridia bacterium]|nr:hypothetical protein [Clostridia bacterium]